MLKDEAFLAELRDPSYDLAIVEMFHFCPAGIAHLARIPKIVLASALGITMAHYEFTGLPIQLSNTPGKSFLIFAGKRVSCGGCDSN